MKFTFEEHDEQFVPKILTIVLESHKEVGDFLKAFGHLPNYYGLDKEQAEKYGDLYDTLEEEYNRWD